MEIKTIKDIHEIHKEFAQRLQKRVEAARAGKARALEVVVKEKEDDLARLEERRKRLRTAKEQAIWRYDEEIRHCEEAIARLEKEIQEGRKALERAAAEAAEQTESKEAGARVNLNTAAISELIALPGVGPELARAIEENRPFDTVDELLKVPGIGRHTLDRLKGHVTVSGS